MRKLLLIFIIFLLGNQLVSAQADYISWEFRGGRLLSNPDGTSRGPGPEPAGLDVADIPSTPITLGRLQSAILGDLDDDDDLDFLSGSQGGTVHYYQNTGTPTAPNWVAASIPTLDTIWIDSGSAVRNQNRPQWVDIDNDDDLDLFIGTERDYEGDGDNDILFYRNIGTPDTPVFQYRAEGIPGLNEIEVAEFPGLGFVDLDDDNDLDLVTLGSDKLTYFKNIGDINNPIFERQSEADSPWDDEDAYNNMDVPVPVFEDFDKDGDYDMFFMIDTGFVRWIENVGTKTEPDFGSEPQQLFNGELTQGEIGSFPTIDFGDVDGDGLKDAILGSFNVARFAWFRQVPVCVSPTTPTVNFTPVTCEGDTSTITISGNLNIASTWSIYTDSCGGTPIGTTTTNTSTFEVTPTAPSTTYYIRGEDAGLSCIDETTAICVEITIPVNAIDDPGFNYSDSSYCSNDTNPTPTITGTTGGTFTTTAGLSIDEDTGEIDIANATPATYTITYTTNGTCPDSSDVEVTIIQQDDANFSFDASSYCTNDSNPTPIITGTSGGTFTSTIGLSIDPGTGVVDIANSTPATYTVTYTTNGTCPNSSDVDITIIQQDDATFSFDAGSYCSNDPNPTPTITGTTGGTFTTTAGLSIDEDTGEIDIANSTPATYTITYTTNGTCPDSSDVEVTIIQQDDANFSFDASSYCTNDSNPTPTITGTSGGTFTSTAGLSIDPGTGAIDIANSTPATYTVTYTTSGTCPNSSTIDITIIQQDDATFSFDAGSYCSNDPNPTPTITGATGGTFSSTTGLSIDSSTGVIDLTNSTPATYTITYITSGACPNNSEVEITIIPQDDASFNYDDIAYCMNDSNPVPNITGTIGGTFSSTTGLLIDSNTGTIDLVNSTPGVYTITYTTSGTCPNTDTTEVTINAIPVVTVQDDSPTLVANTITNATYQWFNCDTDQAVAGETDATFTATINGSYAVEVTVNGCTSRSECFTVDNVKDGTIASFKIYPNPTEGMITVTLPQINTITVYNYYGRVVLETSQNTFDTSKLQSGVYFMRIETNEGRTTKKFVKR